jgi:hypothetical protein
MLKSNRDFLSSFTNTIHMSSMLSGRHYKVSTSKRRKRGASSYGEGSDYDESYVPSQSEPHLHMLVVHMILIWKMLIWSLILKYIKDRSRNGPTTHIKRLTRFVLMNMKRILLLHNFGLRYSMMPFIVTYSKSQYLLISQLIGII